MAIAILFLTILNRIFWKATPKIDWVVIGIAGGFLLFFIGLAFISEARSNANPNTAKIQFHSEQIPKNAQKPHSHAKLLSGGR